MTKTATTRTQQYAWQINTAKVTEDISRYVVFRYSLRQSASLCMHTLCT